MEIVTWPDSTVHFYMYKPWNGDYLSRNGEIEFVPGSPPISPGSHFHHWRYVTDGPSGVVHPTTTTYAKQMNGRSG